MKYAANLSMLYGDRPMLQRPEAAAADGFVGAEVLFPYDLDAGALRAELDRCGLSAVLINTPPGQGAERGLAAVPGAEARFRDSFGLAARTATTLGAPRVHTMAGVVPGGGEGAARRTLLDNLRWASDQANRYGITLTLEGLNAIDVPGYCYARPGQVVEVLAELALPNVRLQFDLYHTAKEGLAVVEELEAALPWIGHCQIAGPPDRHEPAEADTELFDAVRRLDASGYDGWLGFEYRPAGDTSAGLAWRRWLS